MAEGPKMCLEAPKDWVKAVYVSESFYNNPENQAKLPKEYEVVADEWNHSYSHAKAAYPIESVRENKFWINVARVDNTLGDRKLLPTRYGKFDW